jgi:GNAT superfamily N-acetyltransferase
MIEITTYQDTYKEAIIDLILSIQQKEFNVPITLEDQPDLQVISSFYCQKKGGFWVAVKNNQVIGTIALIDIGHGLGALRKMFVHHDFRGKEFGVAAMLMNTLFEHCRTNHLKKIYLGTGSVLKAAMRFYEKNGFESIERQQLPVQYPTMKVDTVFYQYTF